MAYKHRPPQQKGIVLVVALLFLTVLSLLAVSMLESGIMQLKMSRNFAATLANL